MERQRGGGGDCVIHEMTVTAIVRDESDESFHSESNDEVEYGTRVLNL